MQFASEKLAPAVSGSLNKWVQFSELSLGLCSELSPAGIVVFGEYQPQLSISPSSSIHADSVPKAVFENALSHAKVSEKPQIH